MKKLVHLRNKSLYLLVSGILILIAGFIFISCGKDSQLKVAKSDNGPFAIDLSRGLVEDLWAVFWSENKDMFSVAGKELTVEAWVMSRTSSLSGGIFGRMDSKGVVLFMNNNEAKLAIRRTPVSSEPVGCTQINATGTECIVNSNWSIPYDGNWYHIAGVLTDSDHSTTHAPCGGAESEMPHMDIYINGLFENCSTTGSLFADDPANHLLSIGLIGEGAPLLDNGEIGPTKFDGAIDEVRIWTIARTEAQIQSCMGQELSFTVKGDCYIDTSILKGYWRFNEGEGDMSSDFSGGGGNGGFESPPLVPWSGGWTTPGAPITRDPDSD